MITCHCTEDLDALPNGTIVRAPRQPVTVAEKYDGAWLAVGVEHEIHTYALLPCMVVWSP